MIISFIILLDFVFFFFLSTSGNVLYQHPAVPVDDVMWLNTFMTNTVNSPLTDTLVSGQLYLRTAF